jgi:Rha family phage regulatory protein
MGKIKKTKENQIEIFKKDDRSWTTSLDVAEKFGKQHKHVLRDIRNLECQDKDFYRSNFGPITREVQGGQSEYYIISRDGFSLLAMGFTGKEAIQWKIKFLKAFKLMEEGIEELRKRLLQKERQVNKEYKQLKADNTAARRIGIDAIQKWVDYTIGRGTKNPKWWYSLLTEAQYDAIVIPGGHMEIRRRKKELKKKNGHDVLTNEELLSLTMMNLAFTDKAVDESLAIGGDYHKGSLMLNLVKERFKQYGQMISNNFLLQNNMKTLTLAG